MQIETISLTAPQPTGLTLTELAMVSASIDALENAINIPTGGGVGAAVLTRSGRVYHGANLTLAIPSALCAERVAIAHAHVNSDLEIQGVALVRKDGTLIMPCGQCLQLLHDIQTYTRTRITVYTIDRVRGVAARMALTDLLPYPFVSRKLDQAGRSQTATTLD